ncbi:hypothetical protein R3P38DRAFT_2763245 [Favolaschia claudopus]|uniref:Uncharacterized protein n=1 Tax=Favolaschia claudopus TaxID=2862362 RepID=A0AAW0DH36_9AGAR
MSPSNSVLSTIHKIISSITPLPGAGASVSERVLYPVPHIASHVEEYAVDLMQRKGYDQKVDCVLYATDERVPIVVPVPFNIGTDVNTATIDELFVHAYVAYAGLANIVDMSKGRRTVITHNFAPLEYPYTIFYTPPGVIEPKNMSLATNRGRIPWKGNILVVKHQAYPEVPMDVPREEITRINIMKLAIRDVAVCFMTHELESVGRLGSSWVRKLDLVATIAVLSPKAYAKATSCTALEAVANAKFQIPLVRYLSRPSAYCTSMDIFWLH